MSFRLQILFSLLIFISFRSDAQETEKMYLSGTGSDKTVNWQFMCSAGRNAGKWTTIPVPSCWELQGFGKYDYGFARDSVRGKEKGMYRFTFTIPASWKSKKIRIVFEGSMTDTEVKVNGRSAGPTHQGAFYAFSYDITPLLKFGTGNLLEVTVSKHSSNESVNDAERRADYWIFGGIFRPVYLEVLPINHINRVEIDAKANGELTSQIHISGTADRVSLQLYNSAGEAIADAATVAVSKESGVISLKKTFNSPLLWSPEFPNLYKCVFTLYNQGKVVHTISKRIGFRTVEVKHRDGIYINNVKVKMKGVNRHAFRPETGRTTSWQISIEDVLLMKEMNMNAVRSSHYPPDDHFLDVCDSIGLFVMDELAGWHGHYDTETGSKLVKEMLHHDAHHPSVVIWSNGNEGGHNFELDKLFAENDIQKRPVVHPWQLFGGIETQHYREYNYGIGSYDHGHDIVMPTEFLHGLYDGGHGAGLEDYWEMMWRRPLSAGGFLWDFADQGVVRTDKNGMIDTDGNRGADGILGPHLEKEGSFFAIKEIWSPVFFESKEITSSFDGILNIENRYHYTNLKQCSFAFELRKLISGNDSINGQISAPDVKPMEKGRLKIDLPQAWQEFDVLYVTAKDPFQREIFTWSFPLVKPDRFKPSSTANTENKIRITEQDSVYSITANNIHFSIHRQNGLLISVKKGEEIIPFNNGPVLQEGVNNFKNFSHRFDGNKLLITSAFDRKDSYNTLEWTIFPDGLLGMKVNYFPAAYFTSMVGVNFSFPESGIKGVQYMGYGPYRVWKNRMKGNKFGVWNKSYNNTETGESPWIYPEFKGYHSNMYWCKFLTSGNPFTVITTNEDMFLRLFTPAFKTDQWKNYEPIFPSGDISFMQGIPGIGTKTQRNETTGPMGMKHIYYDYEKDPLRWKTIELFFDFQVKE
ncbi:MAG TPA: glycoside hydrolase family 2 TIM barrel-domain containing protein [Chitinophagaceae bacterium]